MNEKIKSFVKEHYVSCGIGLVAISACAVRVGWKRWKSRKHSTVTAVAIEPVDLSDIPQVVTPELLPPLSAETKIETKPTQRPNQNKQNNNQRHSMPRPNKKS